MSRHSLVAHGKQPTFYIYQGAYFLHFCLNYLWEELFKQTCRLWCVSIKLPNSISTNNYDVLETNLWMMQYHLQEPRYKL